MAERPDVQLGSAVEVSGGADVRLEEAPMGDGFYMYMKKENQLQCRACGAPRWFEHIWFKKLDSPWVYRPIVLLLATAPFVAALGKVLHIYHGCSVPLGAGEETMNATWVHSDKVNGLTAMGIFALLLTNVALFQGLRVVVRGASTNVPPTEPEGRCTANCVSRKRWDDYQSLDYQRVDQLHKDGKSIRDDRELYETWLENDLTLTHLMVIATAAGVSAQQLEDAESSDYNKEDYKQAVIALILNRTYQESNLRDQQEYVFKHDLLVNQTRNDFAERYVLRTKVSASKLDLSGKSVLDFIKEDKSKKDDNQDLSKKMKLVKLLERARAAGVSDWELQTAEDNKDHKGAMIALVTEAKGRDQICAAQGPFSRIAFEHGARAIGRRAWLSSEKFDALQRSVKVHVAFSAILFSIALNLLWILYKFLAVRDRSAEKWQDSTIYMLFLPAHGCLDDETDALLATMLVTVVVPASLFASCVIPLWMLSLRLGVELVLADLCDFMNRMDPTLVNMLSLNGKSGSAGAAVFRKNIHMPAVKMIIQLEQLSIWGPSMGWALVGFTLASIGFFPLAVDTRGHTVDATQMMLVLVCTVLLIVPLWVLSQPAYVSTQCVTMLEQLNDMSFFGDKYHKERCHRLLTSLEKVNSGHGLGFKMFDVVIDMNKLYKLATGLVGLSTITTHLVKVGKGEE